MDTVVVELVARVLVTVDVVGLSTVVVAVVVVDSDDRTEDVREVELVEESADVDAVVAVGVAKVVGVVEDSIDVVIDVGDVDDVSMFAEDVIAADVDVTLVDTTSVGVVDIELTELGESSEVLEKVTGDVDSVVVVGVVRAVGVLEGSVDVADELGGGSVCDSIAVGAAEVGVDSEAESEVKADVEEGLITVELSIC